MKYQDGIPIDEYHRQPGETNSGILAACKTPAHYLSYLRQDRTPTPALILGNAVHAAILEPDTFERLYIEEPDLRRNSKAYKKWKADLGDDDRRFLSAADFEQIHRLRDAVFSSPVARQLLTGGVAERSMWWTDPKTGLLCKCRPDYARLDGILIDLKTTMDACYLAFQRSIGRYGYHSQAAYYLEGATACSERVYSHWVWIVVEKAAPYAVAIYTLDQLGIEAGRERYREGLEIIKRCKDSGKFPGYSEEIQEICLPAWA